MYLEENFLKDDFIKAIELKREEHLNQIVDKYKKMSSKSEQIEDIQNQLIARFRLDKKEINSQILKIATARK
jgi:hypothetical protein